MSRQRIVIIGGGIAGLSTAWHLARLGAGEVLLVERERALATQSTAQNAAIVRTAIDDESLRALAHRGAQFLLHPPADFAHKSPILGHGLIVFSRSPGRWSEADCERVDRARTRELMPALPPRSDSGWFFPDEGHVDVGAVVRNFAAGATAADVEIRLGTAVHRLLADGHGVELSDGTVIECDHTVIAAGAWAAPLARAVGSCVDLTPTRRHLIVTRRDPRIATTWPTIWSDEDAFYARPESGGWMLCPCDEDAVDPDRLAASASALESTYAKARAVLGATPLSPPARLWAGLRTHASDQRFVLGRDADVPGLVWAAGLGGHGITCAAAVGEIAAAATIGAPLAPELTEPFSPHRFRTH
ncbi:MAG: FAD-binding oxidoreductase [Planctomycetes bacterium]|nr:FAD-binding oxidoreductase [Planctomycetota bacterium]